MTSFSRVLRIAAAAIVLVPLLVGLFFPSQRLMPDGLDELMVIEAGKLQINPKHPATEASLWLIFRALRFGGYEGRAIRPVQLWNAAWLSLALAGFLVFTRAWRSPGRLAIFACLPFLAVFLLWAADPFLPYWPPGLAAWTWAMAAARSDGLRWRFAVVTGLLVMMVSINPILVLALPIPAWLEAEHLRPAAGAKAAFRRFAVLLALPPVLLYSFLWAIGVGRSLGAPFGATRAPYGSWTAQTLPQGWESLVGVFFNPPNGPLLQAAVAVAIVALVFALLRPGRRSRAWPWLLSALASTLVLLWWAPLQRFFFVLPIWQLVAGRLEGEDPGERRWAPVFPLALLVALVAVNGLSYLKPAQEEDPRRVWIESCARNFKPADRLFMPLFADYTFKYFGGIDSTSLLEPFRHRRPGQSTFDRLREMLEEKKQKGGALFFEVPRPGERWVPQRISERVQLDYREEDIATRFEWGEEVDCGPARFRRLLAVR